PPPPPPKSGFLASGRAHQPRNPRRVMVHRRCSSQPGQIGSNEPPAVRHSRELRPPHVGSEGKGVDQHDRPTPTRLEIPDPVNHPLVHLVILTEGRGARSEGRGTEGACPPTCPREREARSRKPRKRRTRCLPRRSGEGG